MVVYVVHSRRRAGGEGSSGMRTGKNLVRLASRAATAAAPATPSSSSGAGGRSLSRAGGRPLRATSPPPPSSIRSTWESRSLRCDGEEDWEEVLAAGATARAAAREEASDGVVFGIPPTNEEVRAAIASITEVFENPSAVESDVPDLRLAVAFSGHPSLILNHFALDSDVSEVGSDEWIEPAMLVLNSSALLTKEHRSVMDALHLLKEDLSVQKMVMALSTDKNVWHAVMENEVVKEFKSSYDEAKQTDLKGSSTAPPGFMMWVLENTQAKIKEFIEKILGLVNMLFQAGDQNYNMSDDVVRMSFMLSIFVFIVVTIARIN